LFQLFSPIDFQPHTTEQTKQQVYAILADYSEDTYKKQAILSLLISLLEPEGYKDQYKAACKLPSLEKHEELGEKELHWD